MRQTLKGTCTKLEAKEIITPIINEVHPSNTTTDIVLRPVCWCVSLEKRREGRHVVFLTVPYRCYEGNHYGDTLFFSERA